MIRIEVGTESGDVVAFQANVPWTLGSADDMAVGVDYYVNTCKTLGLTIYEWAARMRPGDAQFQADSRPPGQRRLVFHVNLTALTATTGHDRSARQVDSRSIEV